MNRIIKFRVWDGKEMDYEYPVTDQDRDINTIFTSYNNQPGDIVFMEFTGLLDKNGKEIYEGDIVKKLQDGLIKQKIFLIEYMELNNCGDCTNDSGIGFNLYLDDPKELEVIGNIHENPELQLTIQPQRKRNER